MAVTGPEGMAWSCVRGGAAGGWGQGLHRRAVGMERAAQGCGHGPECRSSRSVWTALSDIGFDLGWCCVEPGVGLSDPCGSLGNRKYSMILCNKIYNLVKIH